MIVLENWGALASGMVFYMLLEIQNKLPNNLFMNLEIFLQKSCFVLTFSFDLMDVQTYKLKQWVKF